MRYAHLATLTAFLGCGSDRPNDAAASVPTTITVTASPSTTEVRAVASASAPTPPSGPPAEAMVTAAIASFADDVLDECTEIAALAEDAAKVRQGLDKMVADSKGRSLRVDSCTEAFKDRVVLASCSVERSASRDTSRTNEWSLDNGELVPDSVPGAKAFKLTSRRYLFESTFEDDRTMRECLEMKGKWEAIWCSRAFG
jgi:hypothetical protein